ncbi:MAG: 30S ribosomal protein S16 [Acidiferrobacterales bacterium]
MVTIRLARGGTKKKPFFRIVVADARRAAQGRFIEHVGFFNPRAAEHEQKLEVNLERVQYWLSQGAKPSERVSGLLKRATVGK